MNLVSINGSWCFILGSLNHLFMSVLPSLADREPGVFQLPDFIASFNHKASFMTSQSKKFFKEKVNIVGACIWMNCSSVAARFGVESNLFEDFTKVTTKSEQITRKLLLKQNKTKLIERYFDISLWALPETIGMF